MSDQDPPDSQRSFFESVRFEPVDRSAVGETADWGRPTRRMRFRAWRRSRPFWGGLLCILSGLEIAVIPLSAYRVILVSRSVVLAAVVGAVVAILGLMMWMTPSHNKLYGLLAVLVAVVSFVTSNIGGFLLGGVLGIIGGALGFAWEVLPEHHQGAQGS